MAKDPEQRFRSARSFARELRQEGWRSTPAQAALIIRRVADALAFAHSKGVIHRDIKPANIFMVGRTQPRVLDFGIARVAHRQDGDDPHSGAGSPYYMAPEQVRRDSADRRADVFSLGVVLYELLTDIKPFQGESLAEIREAVLHYEPPLANKVEPTVPKALAAIAARAMAKDPEQRFRSARSFARELRQWLDDNPASADGEKTLPAPAPPPRSRFVLGAALAAVVAATVAAIATWALLAPAAPALAEGGAGPGEARATTPAAADANARTTSTLPGVTAAPLAAPTAAPASIDGAAAAGAEGSAVPATAGTAATSPTGATEVTAIGSSGDPPSLAGSTQGAATAPAAPAAATTLATAPTASLAPATKPGNAAAAAPTIAAAPGRESIKDRRARESRERDTRERDARAAASLVAPATGTVRIAISPWGLVEVDGASSGAAPPITELTLAEGRHQIVIRNGDYAPFSTSVNVTAGQTISVRHKFGS